MYYPGLWGAWFVHMLLWYVDVEKAQCARRSGAGAACGRGFTAGAVVAVG